MGYLRPQKKNSCLCAAIGSGGHRQRSDPSDPRRPCHGFHHRRRDLFPDRPLFCRLSGHSGAGHHLQCGTDVESSKSLGRISSIRYVRSFLPTFIIYRFASLTLPRGTDRHPGHQRCRDPQRAVFLHSCDHGEKRGADLGYAGVMLYLQWKLALVSFVLLPLVVYLSPAVHPAVPDHPPDHPAQRSPP